MGGLVRTTFVAAVATLAVGTASDRAMAQDAPPFDPAIDLQLFDYATGQTSFFSVHDARIAVANQYQFDLMITYVDQPFTVFNVDERQDEIIETRTKVVDTLLAGQLIGSYGLFGKFQLGASLPVVFTMTGDGLDPATGMGVGGLQATGLGDLRLEIKGRAYKSDAIRIAWLGGITVPTSVGSNESKFLGDNLPTLRGAAALQWMSSDRRFSASVNAGLQLRKSRMVYATEVGQQITYGGAGSYKVNDRVSAVAEAFGRMGLTELDADSSPLEALGGARVWVTPSIHVTGGGGAGVVPAIGSPNFRVFFTVGYAPDMADDDGDGVPNKDDRCPLEAEDLDEFEDSDGCADPDNDGDQRPDNVDKCPNEKEDRDGFEDDDGCPELDNDGDGFEDLEDRCPTDKEDGMKPFDTDGCPATKSDVDGDDIPDATDKCIEDSEDFDGFEDWDGCPEDDNDKDGVLDEDDKCGLCAEDKDGFEDDDGCPDLDNDKDGVPDATDQCPSKAETLNGVQDDDGCPDAGGAAAARIDGDRLFVDKKIDFDRRNRLRRSGAAVVIQIAALMIRQPKVTKWRIVVAAKRTRDDDKTRENSQAQADAIKAALVARGVAAELDARGALSDNPIVAIAVLERAAEDEDGSVICPASMTVTPREQPAAPAPAPAPTAPAAAGAATAPTATATAASAPAPAAPPTTVPDSLQRYSGVQKSIVFKRNSDVMYKSSRKLLDKIAAELIANPSVKLTIRAHTDDKRSPDASLDITKRQSSVVIDYLMSKGVALEQMIGEGIGSAEPVGDNKRSSGRAENRRIELTFSVP